MNDNGTSHIAERVWWLTHPCTHFWIRNIYFCLSGFHYSLLLIYFHYGLNTTCSHHEECPALKKRRKKKKNKQGENGLLEII